MKVCGKRPNRLFARARSWALATIAGLLLAACVTETSLITGERQSFAYTWEQEKALGQRSDAQIVEEMGVYRDDALLAYTRKVADEVYRHSAFREPDAPEPYRDAEIVTRVLDSPVVNAFALPGGYIYVTRGLLAHLENEAQLAVVLGHEIGHVAGRHASRRMLKAQWGQIGLIGAAVLGEQVIGQGVGQDLLNLGGSAFQLLLNKHSRDDEREADDLGALWAARAGYAIGEGAAFFRTLARLSEASGGRLPSWQSTHPDPLGRYETMRRLGEAYRDRFPLERVGREAYLRRIEGLAMGEDPRNGYLADGRFYHPELRFEFEPPRGWRVANEARSVAMAPPQGSARAVAEVVGASGAREAAVTLLNRSGFEASRSERISLGGLEAYVVEGVAASEGASVAALNVFVELEGRVYSLLGIASPETYANYRETFVDFAWSFRPLTDPERIEVEPARLALTELERPMTLAEALEGRLAEGFSLEEAAVLNQVSLGETLPKGRILKYPRQGD